MLGEQPTAAAPHLRVIHSDGHDAYPVHGMSTPRARLTARVIPEPFERIKQHLERQIQDKYGATLGHQAHYGISCRPALSPPLPGGGGDCNN
jgi:hypothetical protein